MASDSQGTFYTKGQATRTDRMTKLSTLADSIMWGGSGPVGVIKRVEAEIQRQSGNITTEFKKGQEQGGKELHKSVNAVQKQIASEVLPSAGNAFDTEFLFAGNSRAGPFILECDSKGGRTWQHPVRFTAIGCTR